MRKLYVVLLIILLTPIAVYAWNDCPYGLLNDPFPGQCPRYVDTNQDEICDHSQSSSSGSINNSATDEHKKQNRGNESNSSSSDIQNANHIPKENYNLILVATTTTIIYLITYLLYIERHLKRKNFYRIWNYTLIISFLITGATGLIMAIFINYGIQSSWNLTMDFWHAEFAIIMAVSTFYHFHLYWKQLKKVLTG